MPVDTRLCTAHSGMTCAAGFHFDRSLMSRFQISKLFILVKITCDRVVTGDQAVHCTQRHDPRRQLRGFQSLGNVILQAADSCSVVTCARHGVLQDN